MDLNFLEDELCKDCDGRRFIFRDARRKDLTLAVIKKLERYLKRTRVIHANDRELIRELHRRIKDFENSRGEDRIHEMYGLAYCLSHPKNQDFFDRFWGAISKQARRSQAKKTKARERRSEDSRLDKEKSSELEEEQRSVRMHRAFSAIDKVNP
ncbi:hypothetical protein P3452_12195 [Vibrio parahaemolyticus]|nr:hypothetical protein [Vibrio parahaemolyticus]